VPSKLEDEYRIQVQMKADPFEIDCSQESTVRKTELQPK